LSLHWLSGTYTAKAIPKMTKEIEDCPLEREQIVQMRAMPLWELIVSVFFIIDGVWQGWHREPLPTAGNTDTEIVVFDYSYLGDLPPALLASRH
jgi:hypothetical protein